ncbi:MAG: CDP-glycerol glycerophosphotransferase family protein [Clostridia bacterium]|nr:CDP-glycerol glycerophosphotransferase family protein [Clostridia bacterium]
MALLEKVIRFAKDGTLLKRIPAKIRNEVGYHTRAWRYKNRPIIENRVFVMTYDNAYSCNPRYIVEEMRAQNLPVDIVWAAPKSLADDRSSFPEGVRLVRRGTAEMYEAQASAKIWLDNALNCVWYNVPKKPEQVYINTWHGSMGIKKLGGPPDWMVRAAKANAMTDAMVANSAFEEEVYRTTFWPDVPVWQCGHARNDILFHHEAFPAIRQKVAAALGLSPDTKWMLYAPTFRDDGDLACFNIDYAALKTALEARFGGEWAVLVRMHFKNRTGEADFTETDWLRDASGYPDMQELLCVVDAGITDYSSWAYDYVLTRRPLFLYTPDIDRYDQARGFYYPLEQTPFPMAQDNAALTAAVAAFDDASYQPAIDAFLQARGCYEQGDAAKQVVARIKEILKL